MKKNSISIVLLFLALTAIGCGILNNLRGRQTNSYKSANTNVVNSQPEKPDYKTFQAKAEELAKIAPPVKLDSKAKLKGKIAVVEKNHYESYSMKGFNYEGTDYYQFDLDNFGLTKEQMAVKPEEIDTLVQIKCEKGSQIGKYNVTDGRTLPAYSQNCKVSVIDYKTPSVVAQKNFSSRNLSDNITVYNSTKDVTAAAPISDIYEYIKKFKSE